MSEPATSSTVLPSPGIMPWLKLMRLPTVFTALAGILCAYLLTHAVTVGELPSQPTFWLLLVASACIYLSGMVFNDVFDMTLDQVERPERPIPSGRISRPAAAIFGAVLMLTGIIAAALSGTQSAIVAAVLCVSVLIYDGGAKSTMAGPVVMGVCRGLNILLGASAATTGFAEISSPHVIAACALMIYIVGVTVFAQNEAGNVSKPKMYAGLAIAVTGMLVDIAMFHHAGFQGSATVAASLMLTLLAANIVFRGWRAIQNPQPRLVQKTVGFMLLSIIFLDAAVVFAATGDGKLTAIVLALVIPATLLKRVIPMS